MPSTYTPIATTSLASATNNVVFNSIPQTYTDVIVVVDGQNTNMTNNTRVQFNGDGTSVYSGIYMQGTGSATSGRVTNTTSAYGMEFSETARSTATFHVMNYSNSTTFKTVLVRGGSGVDRTALWSSLWRSTNAITSITVGTFATNFIAGTTITLYGIKAA